MSMYAVCCTLILAQIKTNISCADAQIVANLWGLFCFWSVYSCRPINCDLQFYGCLSVVVLHNGGSSPMFWWTGVAILNYAPFSVLASKVSLQLHHTQCTNEALPLCTDRLHIVYYSEICFQPHSGKVWLRTGSSNQNRHCRGIECSNRMTGRRAGLSMR